MDAESTFDQTKGLETMAGDVHENYQTQTIQRISKIQGEIVYVLIQVFLILY